MFTNEFNTVFDQLFSEFFEINISFDGRYLVAVLHPFIIASKELGDLFSSLCLSQLPPADL